MESDLLLDGNFNMLRSEKVLITGAGGFIGSNLCQYLGTKNYEVISCYKTTPKISSNNKSHVFTLPCSTLDKILTDQKPDYLVHCAGSASIIKSLENPENDFHQNVQVTESLLKSVLSYSPTTRVIFLSSAAVYGNPLETPINENTPTQPISPYGYNKLSTELLCEEYHRNYQLPITILRIFSAYGPGLKKQILWDIYQKSLKESTISLYGTGDETRDFIYIDDLVKTIETVLHTSDFSANKLNIATGTQISVKQLTTIMLEALDISKPVIFNKQNKPGDPKYLSVNITKMNELGISTFTSLKHGIQKYVTWLKTEGG